MASLKPTDAETNPGQVLDSIREDCLARIASGESVDGVYIGSEWSPAAQDYATGKIDRAEFEKRDDIRPEDNFWK